MKKILLLFMLAFFFACKKADERKCLKSAGEEITVERNLGAFTKLFLGPHLEFTMVQDTVNKIVIQGGANLVNFVSSEITEGELRITNDNKCNFLRSYKKGLRVELHFTDVEKVEFQGTKPLNCANKFQLDRLDFVIRDGAGHVNLNLNADVLQLIVTHGWGNFELHGDVNYMRLDVRSNGFGEAYDLNVSDSLHVISSSQELLKVNCNGSLMRAQIIEDGDIWYKGYPTFIETSIYGGGKLIDKN